MNSIILKNELDPFSFGQSQTPIPIGDQSKVFSVAQHSNALILGRVQIDDIESAVRGGIVDDQHLEFTEGLRQYVLETFAYVRHPVVRGYANANLGCHR